MSLLKKRSVVNLLKSRRSIRIFKPINVPDEIVKLLVEVGERAPIPTHLQLYSFIWVKSQEKREELSEICGGEIVKNASIVLLVCGDLKRASMMLDLLEHRHVLSSDKHPVETVMSIFEAALAVDSIIIAAESLGLGSVILDCPLIYAPSIARLFNLPRGIIPLVLLCIGVRGESPPIRPRLPLEIILHEDSYREPSEDELKAYLAKLEKHMEIENYVKKYTGKDLKYLDYLKMRTELNKEVEKDYDALIKYLRENFFKI
ncbi:MAG: nitroreductase family protein [Aigarchaeota archaeon]|nr:nitroreductase family protein [Aigarchaeota archaeon]MCX8192838.1 nitroreductase family protein [Nitrososphaeria archaeon]MDW7986082.1 nitroreductase family protein [Nitrososphaerota archaeon]